MYPTQKELFGSLTKMKGSWKTETPILMVELVCVFMAVFHYNSLLVFENKIALF